MGVCWSLDAWAAIQVGAAVLGVPVKPTIKEVDSDRNVVKTLARAALWEVQTPQVCTCQYFLHDMGQRKFSSHPPQFVHAMLLLWRRCSKAVHEALSVCAGYQTRFAEGRF